MADKAASGSVDFGEDPVEPPRPVKEGMGKSRSTRLGSKNSPPWSNTTKLVIGLTLVAITAALVIGFKSIIGPLLLSFILAYLFAPVAEGMTVHLKISWRVSVSLIFVVMVIILLGLLTWGGIALIGQIQSLVNFLQNNVTDLPTLITNLLAQPIQLGPFRFVPNTADLNSILQQLFGLVQPLLSQVGSLVGSFASSAATTIGWTLFIVLVSYFILVESGGLSGGIINLRIPGYQEDIDRLGMELKRIWNSFLRGQILIVLLTIFVYTVLLAVLGVRYFYGLALMAGLARFVPYIGPAVSWTAYFLVSYFQGHNNFGLNTLVYALVIVGIAWVVDLILDNFIMPRLMADALQVHPAAVMVAALVSASLMGIIGIVLAAPVLATAKLILEYSLRKLTDQDPWEGIVAIPPPVPLKDNFNEIKARWLHQVKRLRKLIVKE